MNESKDLYADTVFINGKVITVDDKNSVAFAVAVKNGRIQRVGNDEIVKEILGEDGPASKLREAQQRSSTGDREKARNDRLTRNGARSKSYTVKRPKPPLSFFIRPVA